MGKIFTLKGRMGRKQYFLGVLGITVVTYALAFAIGFVSAMAGVGEEGASALGFIIGAAGCAAMACLVVRRLHDVGKPGWHYWLFFVPLYNIYLGLVLLSTKGASGANEYGPDPCAA
ncbi:MAG: DUF805 domain-containing protein [Candidatus Krumholzibacteria bacterium]|nr:DUF805 domain-containing protein [Candidatus Krumholzibacteria bacterium]